MRRVVVAVLGSALMVATATPSWADAAQFRIPENGAGHNGGTIGQSRGLGGQRFNGGAQGGQRFGGFGNQGNRGRGFAGGGYRHRGYGAAVGAGVAGLAAGALIGGAIANRGNYYGGEGYDGEYDQGYGYAAPVYAAPAPTEDVEPASEDSEAYCAQRYKSYDPDSQTYLGYDGERHPCP